MIGGRYLLEFIRSLGVVGLPVRMQLLGQAPVTMLDFRLTGAAGNSEGLIGIQHGTVSVKGVGGINGARS